MRSRILAGLLLVAGVACLVLAPSARAVEVEGSAWWSKLATNDLASLSPETIPAPLPTTPDTLVPVGATVPAGQLLVEGSPDGALAMAAVTYRLAAGESSPTLTLPVGPGSTLNPQSVVLACRAAFAWDDPGDGPGRWETKPVPDGFTCVNGILAADLSTVSFGVQPLVSKGLLDVVLVPGRVADLPPEINGSTFRWLFDEPVTDSLRVVAGSDFVEGAGPVVVQPDLPEVLPPDATAGPTTPAVGTPTPTIPGLGSTGPARPSPAAVATTPPVAAAAPALDDDELAAPIGSFGTPAVAAAVDGDDARTLGVALLLAGLLVAAWSAIAPEPDDGMVGLGRFRRPAAEGEAVGPAMGAVGTGTTAAPTSGGLGRFARVRDEPPVPLQ